MNKWVLSSLLISTLVVSGCQLDLGGGGDESAGSPPQPVADTATTMPNTPVTIDVLANDPGGSALTVTGTSRPDHGTVVINADNTLTYTPTTDFRGTDQFGYSVRNGDGQTSGAFVTVTVGGPAAQPPVANGDTVTTPEDTRVIIRVLANDTATTGQTLTISAVNRASRGTLVVNADQTVTYTPDRDFNGTDRFTYIVRDSQDLVASATVTITVSPVNDAPTITSIAPQTINEDNSTGLLSFTVGDVDNAANLLTVTASSSDTNLIPVANVVFRGNAANRTVTVTPTANANGRAVITVNVSDGTATTTTFAVTVNPVNDAPTITSIAPQTINEDNSTGLLSFTVDDVDNAANLLTVTASSSDTNLIPVANVVFRGNAANRTVTVTPTANANGRATITVNVFDGTATTSTTFTVTVTPVNDVPTITLLPPIPQPPNPPLISIPEDTSTGSLDFTVGDDDNDPLTVTASSDNQSLIPDANVILGGSGANRTVTITPLANANGSALITVNVSDGTPPTVSTTFKVTVNPINDNPFAGADQAKILFDPNNPSIDIDVLGNDSDPERSSLTIINVQGGQGQVNIINNGTLLRYTLAANALPDTTDSFQYTISDGQGGTATATVTVKIVALLTRISEFSGGGEGLAYSKNAAAISDNDGCIIAFESLESFSQIDTNGVSDIYVHDRCSTPTATILVSVGINSAATGGSFNPSISADGNFIAFESDAGDLVNNDSNRVRDIFVYDRIQSSTTRVSVSFNGVVEDGASFNAAISADGNFIAFESDATNLVANDINNSRDVFVTDWRRGVTELVSVSAINGLQANSDSSKPAISGDGRYVVFQSKATNLDPSLAFDSGSFVDIFVRDRINFTTRLVSVSLSQPFSGNGDSMNPTISNDGNFIAFESDATDLVVNGDTNGKRDIFVYDQRDLQNPVTTLVSITSNGGSSNNDSFNPAISGDGNFVAFESLATNLVNQQDVIGFRDVFVRRRDITRFQDITRLSFVTASGFESNGDSFRPALNFDGSYVAFDSEAANLIGIGNDENFVSDVFVAPNLIQP